MAKSRARRNQSNEHKDFLKAHATADPNIAERMSHRRSGAAGAHSDSGIHPRAAAGRKSRMGSRAARRNAAMRDWS